ncbi:GGH family protein [Megaselia abdita]
MTSEVRIGILCIDISTKLREQYGAQYKSYIKKSYVDFVEASKGTFVPILIGKDEDYYRKIMLGIHGILIPGGRVFFEDKYNNDETFPNKCVPSFEIIYKIAEELNQNGNFPILGICLGFQLLLYMSSQKNIDRIHDCDNEENSVPLEILKKGRLFKTCSEVFQPPLRYNQQYRITEDSLRGLDWTILSTAKDRNGKPFVAAVEHKTLPFYGVQFHPEKSMTLQEDLGINETSVEVSNHISRFFIDECSKYSTFHSAATVKECEEVFLFE